MKIPTLRQVRLRIIESPPVQSLLNWSQTHSVPGFFKVPIYDVAVFLYNEVRRFDLMTRANSIAFSFFLALFPTLIVLFTLVPYFSDYILAWFGMDTEHFLEILQNEIRQVLPGKQGVGNLLFEAIRDIATKPQAGLLSIGFVLVVYFASNGTLAMMKSFEKSHLKVFKSRTALRKRGIAILLTLQLGILALTSVLLITLGRLLVGWLSEYIQIAAFTAIGIYFFRWVAIVLVFYFGISVLYRYGASTHRRFSFFSPGTTLATILILLSSLAFSFYVDNFGAYSKLYGSIGTIIVLMLWIQINSLILLLGFELNASIAVNRDLKEEVEED